LFSIARYQAVAERYLRAIERRLAAGLPIDRVASVASFFLSRIDVLVDRLLRQRIVPDRPPAGPDPRTVLGNVAIANAQLAYQAFRHILEGDRWIGLAKKAARVQRLLWASTSTKDPSYPDLMYVEPLIGPMTINTMPGKTIAAFLDHGTVEDTIEQGLPAAQRIMEKLEQLGVRFELVAAQLENEAVQNFIDPYDSLLQQLTRGKTAPSPCGTSIACEGLASGPVRQPRRCVDRRGRPVTDGPRGPGDVSGAD
jgi:transaldolase